MNILHYSLGIPPYRSGGLTKYSIDLAIEQSKKNIVFLLFPGRLKFFSKNPKLKYYKNYKDIKVFEVINPQNVSLLNGISNVKKYTKKADINIFKNFFKEHKIEIIHIHTFMGLYKELLIAAKELNIKICYTTHDFFGLAPNPNFFDVENKVNLDRSNIGFSKCNINPTKEWKVYILQSVLYRELKMLGLVAKIKKHLNSKSNTLKNSENYIIEFSENDYSQLKLYYDDIFKLIDKYLFNSIQTKEIFEQFIDVNRKSNVISITHSDIKDERVKKEYGRKILTGAYLGPYKDYKGFYDLIDNIKNNKNRQIKFKFYGDEVNLNNTENISFEGSYKYSDLKNIFKDIDFVIVPSKCLETFGFVVLEAISHGIPVLSSNTVGAKDILFEKGIIYDNLDDVLNNEVLLKEKLYECNKNIISDDFVNIMPKHCEEIIREYIC